MSVNVYALAAVFDSPDEIIKAAAAVRDSKYSDFDVHTPYPIHGMDHAMGLKPTKVPWVTLTFGLIGLSTAVAIQTGMMTIDYQQNIGGKPIWPLPGFVPIIFELTVLFATLTSVFFMLVFFCKLPYNNDPLHDTPYMKDISADCFGLIIRAKDSAFEFDEVQQFLQSLKPQRIEAITPFAEGN